MSNEKTWDSRFAPGYTPEEMLKLGVFEGKYINNIKGIPSAWKKIPKVLGPNDTPDPTLNYYGVKSRLPLSVWQKNGWIKPQDPNGWFAFYINYFLGRRDPEYDNWQIGRWNSYIARHQGQLNANPKSKNKDEWLKSKQGLLQWGWNWEQSYTEEQRVKNAKRIAKIVGVALGNKPDKKDIALESFNSIPIYIHW